MDKHSPKASAEPRPSKRAAFGAKIGNAFKSLVYRKPKEQTKAEAACSTAAAQDGVLTTEAPAPTTEDADSKSKIFWPLDLLAIDFKDVRVLTFGYDSSPSHSTKNNLYTLSKSLLARLASERETCVSCSPPDTINEVSISNIKQPNRPLIFVCHSLGGILTKFVRSQLPHCQCPRRRYSREV
jgi:hypothetical protein